MKYHLTIKFKIRYVFIGISSAIVVGVVLFYILNKLGVSFGFSEIATYLVGTIAIVTLIFHSLNLENQINNQENNNIILKSKYTYDIISKWNEVSMVQSAANTKLLISEPERQNDLSDQSRVKNFDDFLNNSDNVAYKRDLLLVINYFETVAIMVETDHVDHEIIKKAFRTLFISYYNGLKNYIDFRQKSSPATWCYYESLVKDWIEKSKKN